MDDVQMQLRPRVRPVNRPPRSREVADRRRSADGFTLIELLVVLLVIGAGLAAVAPALPRAPKGADGAAHRLRDVLAHARRTAAERGRIVVVELELATGRYRVSSTTEGDVSSAVISRGNLDVSGPGRIVGRSSAERAVFRFGPLGPAVGEPVTLMDTRGRGPTVRVDPWTGRIDVSPR